MAWVRISDDFYDHHGHAPLELSAWGLWLWSIAWSNRNLTNGEVPKATVRRMDPDGEASGALIDAGRWIDKGDHVAIHDYLEYQPSAEQIRRKREKERERWHRRGSEAPPEGPDTAEPPPPLRVDSTAEPNATPRVSQHPTSSSNDSEGAASSKSKRRQTTPCPTPFAPRDEDIAWVERTWPGVNWDLETRKFVNSAKAHDRRYADWYRAWRSWMDNAGTGRFA